MSKLVTPNCRRNARLGGCGRSVDVSACDAGKRVAQAAEDAGTLAAALEVITVARSNDMINVTLDE